MRYKRKQHWLGTPLHDSMNLQLVILSEGILRLQTEKECDPGLMPLNLIYFFHDFFSLFSFKKKKSCINTKFVSLSKYITTTMVL